MIAEVVQLGKTLSRYYSPVQVWMLAPDTDRVDPNDKSIPVMDGDIAQFDGVRLFAVDATYPGETGQGNVDVGIQLQLRTRSFDVPFSLLGFLARHPVIHGPITIDLGPPAADFGAAMVMVNATLVADLTYPTGYIDEPSETERITITYVHGEEALGMDTVPESTP